MNPGQESLDVSAWRVVSATREGGCVVAQVETPEGTIQLVSSSTPAEARAAAAQLSPMGRLIGAAMLEALAGVSEDGTVGVGKTWKERQKLRRERKKQRLVEATSAAAYAEVTQGGSIDWSSFDAGPEGEDP